MADSKRAELIATVADACEGLADCGFLGLLEAPVLKILTDLHKLNDTERLSEFIGALEEAATRMISAKAPPGFPELMGELHQIAAHFSLVFFIWVGKLLAIDRVLLRLTHKPAWLLTLLATVVSQLLRDVEGPGAPPEGADSPIATEFRCVNGQAFRITRVLKD